MTTVRARGLAWALLLTGLLAIALPGRAHAQAGSRCFAETGFCLAGRIREFWEQNGGLSVFGLPVGPQQAATIESRQLEVQWFERARVELHPESARPYDVLLGRLGVDRLAQQGRDPLGLPASTAQPGCRFFAETRHSVCGDILKAWRASGLELDGKRGTSEAESLALFGLPLSDVQAETLSDGQAYAVQWFERARVELHPENRPPYNVLLGLLGNEIRASLAPPATPTPADPCADVPAPQNARIRPGRCVGPGETLTIDIYGFQPNELVGFWLTAPDGKTLGASRAYAIGPGGSAEGLPFDTRGLPPGLWFWVFKSATTEYAAVVYFKLLK